VTLPRTPVVYSAAIDEADYDFVMIMEDLTARCDPAMAPANDRRAVARHARVADAGKYWGDRVLREARTGGLEPFPDVEHAAGTLPARGTTWRRRRRGLSLTIDQLSIPSEAYINTLTRRHRPCCHGEPAYRQYLFLEGEVGSSTGRCPRANCRWMWVLLQALTVEDRRRSSATPRGYGRARTAPRVAEFGRDLAALTGVVAMG